MTAANRETWLEQLAQRMDTAFFGGDTPRYRVTCGFPSRGGTAARARTIGQCWKPGASQDKSTEIIISITVANSMEVAAILAHELIHAQGIFNHGPEFRKHALRMGLEGKMTATTAGEAFKAAVKPWLDELGPYPHAKLDATDRKKQGTRMVKMTCRSCGYIARTTRKWIASVGPTHCPLHGEMEVS